MTLTTSARDNGPKNQWFPSSSIGTVRSMILLYILASVFVLSGSSQKFKSTNESSLKLWYGQPANSRVIDISYFGKDDPEWLKALPLENGSLGVMVFGDVYRERIQLNEESMWSVSRDYNNNLDAFPSFGKIRELLFQGKYKEAVALTQQTQICKGQGSGRGFVTVTGLNYSPEPGKDGWISPGYTTYFINPAGGDDNNSGKTKNQAWRTFNHINQLLLSPGDRIEITSPGSTNQTLILKGEGTADNPVKVHFASGRYDFFPDNIHRKRYDISNTNDSPDSLKVIGILLEHAKNFEISGAGAEIVYRGKMIEVCIDSCENISIADLHFDYHRPTVSEFKVVAGGDDYVDIKIHKDSDYKVENDSITWYGEGWTYHTPILAQELNLETNDVKRLWNPLKGLGCEELEPGLVRVKGKNKMKKDHVYQLREIFRDYAAVFTRGSKNITWKDVNFHFLHGMGVVCQFSENLTFDSVVMAPDSTSGRTTSSWADCLHISGCKGKVLVKNCIFQGAHDDAINIHGTYLQVAEKLSNKQVRVRFKHPQTYGFMAFNRGDEVEFINSASYKSTAKNMVKEAVLLNPKEMILTFEKSTPQELNPGDVIENVTWTPEVEIRGCRVSWIPTHGFLLSTRRKILVEGNVFIATHMSALLMAIDANSWYESGYVYDLTIRNNSFFRCAEPVIFIDPGNRTENNTVYQNVKIENNEFVLSNELIVKAKSTKELVVTGNTIFSQKKLNDEVSIKTNDCSDVRPAKNDYRLLSK
jgi:hypothetical protein